MKRKWIPEIISAILYLSVACAVFFVSARFMIYHQVPELRAFVWTQFIALVFGLLRIPFLKYEVHRRTLNLAFHTIIITLLIVAYIYLSVERIMTIRDHPSFLYPSVLQLMVYMSFGLTVFNAVVVYFDDYFKLRRGEAVVS